MSLRPNLLLCSLVLTTACGGDEPATSTDTANDTGQSAEVDAPDPFGCTPLARADLAALVFDKQDDVSTSYSMELGVDVGVPAADYLVLQFINYNERIEQATGTFALDEAPNDNFGTCPECVAIWVDQADPSLPPGKVLFQSSGTITLDLDPRTRRLVGRLEGVRFREIAIDPMTLSSTFVPDGECMVMSEPLDFAFRWVPPEWTCDAGAYHHDDGCDCACGAPDPDCAPSIFDSPLAVPSSDCTDGELCVEGRCAATCAIAFGDTPARACPSGQLCTIELPDDLCASGVPVDPAALGQACTTSATYCAVADGLPGGLCSWDTLPTCRPLCASRADCAPEEHCYVMRGDPMLGEGKGYCTDGAPSAWYCEPDKWEDGQVCHCGCGFGDPDCDNPALPVEGCEGGARCGDDGLCPDTP